MPSLDRLGRSIQDLISIVSGLRKRGIGFPSPHEALDTTRPAGQARLPRTVAPDRVIPVCRSGRRPTCRPRTAVSLHYRRGTPAVAGTGSGPVREALRS
ncbi:recombinase family protein [Streptomyces sp. NPDC046900]|uniref:recombinase family protein n=1 Tax=Streptomyces sp. NPDC046900 TaxID=3155473 RepID=UPI0033C1FA54